MFITKKQIERRLHSEQGLNRELHNEIYMLRQELDWMQEQQEIWEQAADQLISVVDEMWERFIYDPNVKRQDLAALVRRADSTYKQANRVTDMMAGVQ